MDSICVGCKNFLHHGFRIARENNVPALVSGGNILEETSFKKALLGLDVDMEIQKTFSKAWTGIARGLIRNPYYLRSWYLPTMIKGYLFGDPNAPGSHW
jgi:hypothetical protein